MAEHKSLSDHPRQMLVLGVNSTTACVNYSITHVFLSLTDLVAQDLQVLHGSSTELHMVSVTRQRLERAENITTQPKCAFHKNNSSFIITALHIFTSLKKVSLAIIHCHDKLLCSKALFQLMMHVN